MKWLIGLLIVIVLAVSQLHSVIALNLFRLGSLRAPKT